MIASGKSEKHLLSFSHLMLLNIPLSQISQLSQRILLNFYLANFIVRKYNQVSDLSDSKPVNQAAKKVMKQKAIKLSMSSP